MQKPLCLCYWTAGIFSSLLAFEGQAITTKRTGAARDYCQFEDFDAHCEHDEVILMKTARYGRMRVGRCVSRDYGFIGCVANVMGELDRKCSGQRTCHFSIPTLREIYQPCPKDLTAYLEASYTCVKVSNLVNKTCSERRPLTLNETVGYLSSLPVSINSHGSTRCPLLINGQPGQTINFTLYSLNILQLGTSHSPDKCPYHAIVRDGDVTNVSVSLCANKDNRKESLYVSKSSSVVFAMGMTKDYDGQTQVLVQYEVVGCPDPVAPANAWMRRTKDRAVVKCNHTSETWYLTCKDYTWVGSVSNCTKIAPFSSDKIVTTSDAFPLGLLIAVAIGVIVGIIMGIVMLVFVFVYRRKARRRKLRYKAKNLLEDETSQENEENYARRLMHGGESTPALGKLSACQGGEYTQMWELRRAQQPMLGTEATEGTYATRGAAPASIATLPPPCCANKTTFITFKPREPTYERGKFGLNALLQRSYVNGDVPFYVDTESDSNDETYRRPDLLRQDADKSCSVKFKDQQHCVGTNLCEHCALHPSNERLDEDEDVGTIPPSQSV